jgi:hypothetical protein
LAAGGDAGLAAIMIYFAAIFGRRKPRPAVMG